MESDQIHPDWLSIGTWQAPDGWALRRFRVDPAAGTTPGASLLFLTGRADFLEKYIESYDYWRRHGCSVEGFDWRGQGGSGRLLADTRIGHCDSYEPMLADLGAYARAWMARTPPPHFVLGHSMGGHLVLRYLAEQTPPIAGAVLLSPMLGLNSGPLPEALARLIAQAACLVGLAERRAWSEGKGVGSGHRQTNLTHSIARYDQEMAWRAVDPRLDLGPPSWGWLRASWASIARVRPTAERVLILHADHDPLVRARAIRSLAARLAHARCLGHPTAAHELLREIDPIRLWALEEIGRFIGTNA